MTLTLAGHVTPRPTRPSPLESHTEEERRDGRGDAEGGRVVAGRAARMVFEHSGAVGKRAPAPLLVSDDVLAAAGPDERGALGDLGGEDAISCGLIRTGVATSAEAAGLPDAERNGN